MSEYGPIIYASAAIVVHKFSTGKECLPSGVKAGGGTTTSGECAAHPLLLLHRAMQSAAHGQLLAAMLELDGHSVRALPIGVSAWIRREGGTPADPTNPVKVYAYSMLLIVAKCTSGEYALAAAADYERTDRWSNRMLPRRTMAD